MNLSRFSPPIPDDSTAVDWVFVPSPTDELTSKVSAATGPTLQHPQTLDNTYMISGSPQKDSLELKTPSKKRYVAFYAATAFTSALLISALALIILHHGLPPMDSALNDELSLLPKIAGALGGTALLIGAGALIHYRYRKQKLRRDFFSSDEFKLFQSSAL